MSGPFSDSIFCSCARCWMLSFGGVVGVLGVVVTFVVFPSSSGFSTVCFEVGGVSAVSGVPMVGFALICC